MIKLLAFELTPDMQAVLLTWAIVAVGVLLLFVFVSFSVFNWAFRARRKTQAAPNHFEFLGAEFADQIEKSRLWFLSQPYEVLQTKSGRLTLKGYFLKSPVLPLRGTAILVHGFNGSPVERMNDGKMYIEKGFNVFLPYLRGHGQSQGKFIGMGNPDNIDTLCWVNHLSQLLGKEHNFVLSGNSMGGATVATLSGNSSLPPCVKAIVCDSAFTSISDEANHIFKKLSRPLLQLLKRSAEFWCRLVLQYDFRTNTPLQAVARSHTPTFFMHGEIDSTVPVDMTYRLFEACSAPKELYIVKNSEHCCGYLMESEVIAQKVMDFFNNFLD